MNKRLILVLVLIILYPQAGFCKKSPRWLPDMTMAGFGCPGMQLYRNSMFQSKAEPSLTFMEPVGTFYGWAVDDEHRKGIGLSIMGLQHVVKEEYMLRIAERGGPKEFGEVWFHDWSEWNIGLSAWKIWPRNPSSLFKGIITGGLAFSSRGNRAVYIYGPDQFLYPAWKPGFGKFISAALFYEMAPVKKSPDIRIHFGIQYLVGNVLADMTI